MKVYSEREKQAVCYKCGGTTIWVWSDELKRFVCTGQLVEECK